MSWTRIVLFIQLFFRYRHRAVLFELLQKSAHTKGDDRQRIKERNGSTQKDAINQAESEPLSERVRPKGFQDIVGQEDGIRALKAALCGPNPQHVIIYGPPGVGKTAAARLVMEEAKASR